MKKIYIFFKIPFKRKIAKNISILKLIKRANNVQGSFARKRKSRMSVYRNLTAQQKKINNNFICR